MVGFAQLVGEGQLTDAAAAGERRLWVDCCRPRLRPPRSAIGAARPLPASPRGSS